ncbi:MAG TPA: hypothetical protein VN540_08775 [Clostridia bacterium]|nr:hypothetical protein [Clostridia bacterium]
MGFRTRELEQALGQKENELIGLRQRVDELIAIVERYRSQESAIAGALTRAQTAAEKIAREAQEEKMAILRDANDTKLEAEREARGILADAERRAGIIEEGAKQKAREIASRAEGFMADYRGNAGKLVTEFRRTAAMASEQAKAFADYMNKLSLDGVLEISREYDHVAAVAATPAQDMPDDYVDPASLMRSIYAIEQREIPEQEAAAEQKPELTPVWESTPAREPFASTIKPEHRAEPERESAPASVRELEPAPEQKAAPAGQPASASAWEPELARDPFIASLRPEPTAEPAKKEPEKAAWDAKAVDLGKHEENERVWTVEEIVERTSATDSSDIDDELNAIIEDVLRGS